MQSFNKNEKLKSRKIIDEIFKSGKSLLEFPLKLYYIPIVEEAETIIQFGVSVPKKNIKRAVKRNLLKRRIKEAYRLNKSRLLNDECFKGAKYAFLIVYLEKSEINYHSIEEKIISLLNRFKTIHEKRN